MDGKTFSLRVIYLAYLYICDFWNVFVMCDLLCDIYLYYG